MKKIESDKLTDLRVVKIRHYSSGSVISMEFTLSDGTVSPLCGEYRGGLSALNKTVEFPEGKDIRSIKVRASENWVNHIQFLDESGSTFVEIKGTGDRGDWYTTDFAKGERLVGFQYSADSDKYMRRLGFVTLKPQEST